MPKNQLDFTPTLITKIHSHNISTSFKIKRNMNFQVQIKRFKFQTKR